MNERNKVAVRCHGLTKHYGEGEGEITALRGVDFDVDFGEVVMLVGPSGCGKTTLVSIVSTILAQDGGECEVLGHDVRSLSEQARASLRNNDVGIVFQSFNLLPALTALDNVAVPLLIAGSVRSEAESRAMRTLDAVGLEKRSGAHPSKMSGGELQRVAIARALVHDPRLLICDEPTSNLDAEAGHAVMALVRDVAMAPNRAIVVVTHDSRILEFADRIAHMEDGRVVDVARRGKST